MKKVFKNKKFLLAFGLIGLNLLLGQQNTFSKEVTQSIFYVNDIHGQVPKMEQITTASFQYDDIYGGNENIDSFKFSAGDICIGSDKGVNRTSVNFLDLNEIEATAVGNHEYDMSASVLSDIMKNTKTRMVASNAYIPKNHPLYRQTVKSVILTGKSGEKYGIIGAQSPTLIERMKNKALFEGIKISGGKQAYRELQSEIDKLTAKGINKIIIISHSGYEEEKLIAQNVNNADIIIGGHSHDLIFDVTEGKNLQYSPKGEPVIITQAGRDGKNFGILVVKYDDNGIITEVQNNVFNTEIFPKNNLMMTLTNTIQGVSPVVANVKSTESLTEKMNIEENPYHDTFMDMVKAETGAEIVLVNSTNFRGILPVGNVTERDISGCFPFKNKMCVTEISEKALVEAINHGGKSVTQPDYKPSILQVSGMEYRLDKNGVLTYAAVINKNGSKSEINVKNPSETKKFTVAYDDYLYSGGDGFSSLKDTKLLKKYPYDKDRIIIEYLKSDKCKNKNIEIRCDGRIKVEK